MVTERLSNMESKFASAIVTGRKGKPRRGDIGVLNTHAHGVPLSGYGSYAEKLARGLNELRLDGWKLLTVATATLMIFQRTK